MSKQDAFRYVEEYKARIDRGIEEELARRLEEVREISPHLVPIVEVMRELSVGGKRLRAVLTILGYELSLGSREIVYREKELQEVVRAGVVMELFHLGLLIQDDVMDRDGLRRGVKTIHMRYTDLHLGESVAVLAGDYTFGWVTEILTGLRLPAENKQAALSIWGKYFTRVGYGQTLDVMAIADEETALQILALKSGEYSCVLPLLLGATLATPQVSHAGGQAGGDKKLLSRLEKYGMEVGWVFQLRDDWLSEWGEEGKTGKPVGGDKREGKKTFATMYGRTKLEAEIARHVEEGKKYAGDEEVLVGLLEWMAMREN